MYCNTLNGRLFLIAGRSSTIDRDLRNDAIIKMLLQCVNSKSIHIASVDELLKQQINIQLIVMLFPRIVAEVFPGFKSAVHLADGLKNGLCSKACNNVFPSVILINGVCKHQIHKINKVIHLFFLVCLRPPFSVTNLHTYLIEVGFGDIQIKEI